jgi:MFS family permease
MKAFSYGHTRAACYLGYISQAIVNNLAPLLFFTFHRTFNVSLSSLALLISLNFGIQLLIDLAAVKYIDRIGYRAAAVGAQIFCTAGIMLLGILPFALPNPFAGLVIAVFINALGGGLLEVIVSPIVEAIPGGRKAASMALLHSFYCWGYVGVVLLSTLYFNLAGVDNWRWLCILWAVLPMGNIFLFLKAPIKPLTGESETSVPPRTLFTAKVFIILFLLMICAGASEQAMSQWASFFAEAGLHVSKTTGDILGPCAFAVLMGLARIFIGMQKGEIKIERILLVSGGVCIASYLITVFSPFPLLSLAGCALCGLSVGAMWPGTFSAASRAFPKGGTAMFAVLALAGDAGCGGGPGLVGLIMSGTTLKTGLLAAVVFPLVMVAGTILLFRKRKSMRDLPPSLEVKVS